MEYANYKKVLLMLITTQLCFSIFTQQVWYFHSQDCTCETRQSISIDVIDSNPNTAESRKLQRYIADLKAIKVSATQELQELELKLSILRQNVKKYRLKVKHDTDTYDNHLDKLTQLDINIKGKQKELIDLENYYTPRMSEPDRILPIPQKEAQAPQKELQLHCHGYDCFDFSRCSMTSQFPVYVYDVDATALGLNSKNNPTAVSVVNALKANPHTTLTPTRACVFIVVVNIDSFVTGNQALAIQQYLSQLPYWNETGRNHILINVADGVSTADVFEDIDTGLVVLAQTPFTMSTYRRDYDFILPPFVQEPDVEVWKLLPRLIPARRKYMLTFVGDMNLLSAPSGLQDKNLPSLSTQNLSQHHNTQVQGNASANDTNNIDSILSRFKSRNLLSTNVTWRHYKSHESYIGFERHLIDSLKNIESNNAMDKFHFRFSCDDVYTSTDFPHSSEWSLCGSAHDRGHILTHSTFALILAPLNSSIISTTSIQMRIYEALKFGAIPVILGSHVRLPFDHVIPWEKAAVVLPKGRITELHYLLRSIADSDILEYRRQGRHIWETYFSTTQQIVDTLLATVRMRLNIPALPSPDEPSQSVFDPLFVPLTKAASSFNKDKAKNEILGPVENPFASLRYQRNFTQQCGRSSFTPAKSLFYMYPSSPFDPVLPTGAQQNGSQFGFRPIGDGRGGDGKEFTESIGGNWPREQFTIVMVTYEREAVLMATLARLNDLPYLNKIVVVWNSPTPPAANLTWPKMHVPVEVVKTKKNSLNNRFLPYDAIETDAVLSLDDDSPLFQDEIILGFKVWRENRERLVGYPGRYHSWDVGSSKWFYKSSFSCELSMILTGAAFLHKYFMYQYSYTQPQAIRDLVDEYMNCEDLAMNFLISDITRKPPIKVTSRLIFKCDDCPTSLSQSKDGKINNEYFSERNKCMDVLEGVYGYSPLLYTQNKADSLSYGAHVPHAAQTCFQYV